MPAPPLRARMSPDRSGHDLPRCAPDTFDLSPTKVARCADERWGIRNSPAAIIPCAGWLWIQGSAGGQPPWRSSRCIAERRFDLPCNGKSQVEGVKKQYVPVLIQLRRRLQRGLLLRNSFTTVLSARVTLWRARSAADAARRSAHRAPLHAIARPTGPRSPPPPLRPREIVEPFSLRNLCAQLCQTPAIRSLGWLVSTSPASPRPPTWIPALSSSSSLCGKAAAHRFASSSRDSLWPAAPPTRSSA